MIRTTLLVASLLTVATACGGSDGDADVASADSGIEDTTTAPLDDDANPPSAEPDLASFCSTFALLQGEVPEEYVGSTEHVTDIEALLAVAPADVASEIDAYRAFLASGAVDASIDPESTQFDNWPGEIQTAILDVQAFADDTC